LRTLRSIHRPPQGLKKLFNLTVYFQVNFGKEWILSKLLKTLRVGCDERRPFSFEERGCYYQLII
jgi:hypothetical protein